MTPGMAHQRCPFRCHQQYVHQVVASAMVIALHRLPRKKKTEIVDASIVYVFKYIDREPTHQKRNAVDQASPRSKWTKARTIREHRPFFLNFNFVIILFNPRQRATQVNCGARNSIDWIGERNRTDCCNGCNRAIYMVIFRITKTLQPRRPTLSSLSISQKCEHCKR